MTRDDIIRMAREAGIPETATEGVFIANSDDLGRLIAAEREACAKMCEAEGERVDASWVSCAFAIRERGAP
jgi:predicted ThiF/HesA family dinucleotide-utilizing enzyme